MKKHKYVYNPKTLQYEPYQLTTGDKVQRGLGLLSLIGFCSFAIFALAYYYFPTPKEQQLVQELEQANYHIENMSEDFSSIAEEVEHLQMKDAEVHRMIFGIDPIDEAVWDGGVGGHRRYKSVITDGGVSSEMIEGTLTEVDKLKRKVALQRESLDTLFQLAIAKEKRLASIPSIKPVREDRLKRKLRNLSGYGMRLHPVHKVKKFHKGIDFTAPRGTDIISTGNGKVIRVEKRRRGYGKNIIIDHGYGYTTLYAHLSQIDVKKGDTITKGQVIGKVGNTGTSTASHLHYEVRIDGKAVNPINYCMDGLSLEEYRELVDMAAVANQSFD